MSIIGTIRNYDNYTALVKQTDTSGHVYYLNEINDMSAGYVFEINDFDISHTLALDPSFEQIFDTQITGLPDVSAVAILDVSLSQYRSLFSFITDSEDINDVSNEDLKFGINSITDLSGFDVSGLNDISGFFSDFSFSDATVVENRINTSYAVAEQQIKKDYVRDLAKQVTGGYTASDIFGNETNLRNAVVSLDASFQESLTNTLSTLLGEDHLTTAQVTAGDDYATAYRAAQALFTVNTLSTDNRLTTLLDDISYVSYIRTQTTATDLSLNSEDPSLNSMEVPLRFHAGDKIAVRLVYHPNSAQPIGNNTIGPRSYKVLLNLVE